MKRLPQFLLNEPKLPYLVLLTALAWVLFASQIYRYPTPIISDEVKYLLGAKYLFEPGDSGTFAEAMKGYSFILHLMSYFLGSVESISHLQLYRLAAWVNSVIAAAVLPISFAICRKSDLETKHSVLVAVAVVSLPIFPIFVPFSMTELIYSVVCIAFVFALASFVSCADRPKALTALLLFVLSFLLVSIKVIGIYYAVVACVVVLTLPFCKKPRSAVAVVLIAAAIISTELSDFRYLYDARSGSVVDRVIAASARPGFWLGLSLSAACSAALLAIYAVPLWGRRQKQVSTETQSSTYLLDAGRFSNCFFVVTIVAFVVPAIAISCLFHATIDRLTNFRTVASTLPMLVLAMSIRFAPTRHLPVDLRNQLSDARLRLFALTFSFCLMISCLIFRDWFIKDNFFDFLTWLPFYDLLIEATAGKGLMTVLVIFVLTSLFAGQRGFGGRLIGIVFLNAVVFGYFLNASWSKDTNRSEDYVANERLYNAIKDRLSTVKLIELPGDIQWVHFGYPYIWSDRGAARVTHLNSGEESVSSRDGFVLIRNSAINAMPTAQEYGGGTTFFAYDTKGLRTFSVDQIGVDELIARRNAINVNPIEQWEGYRLAFLRPQSLLGPFFFAANAEYRLTLLAAPASVPTQYESCSAVVGRIAQPLQVISKPKQKGEHWALSTTLKFDTGTFGMVRIQCSASAKHSLGVDITLPLTKLSLAGAGDSLQPDPAASKYLLGEEIVFGKRGNYWKYVAHAGLVPSPEVLEANGWSPGATDETSWTSGKKSQLRMRLDPSLQKSDGKNLELQLSLKGAYLVPGKHERFSFIVRVEDKSIASFTVDSASISSLQDLRMPIKGLHLPSSGIISIALEFDGVQSPERLGQSKDPRELGLLIKSMRIVDPADR